jgi:hypothetical protein
MLEDVDVGIKIHGGKKDIDSAETETVDSVLLSSSLSNTWTVKIVFGNKTEHSIVAGIKTEADVEHIQYGISGDTIDYTLDVVIDGGKMKLFITNNESSLISVKFARVMI